MNVLKRALIAAAMLVLCTVIPASAEQMMLEYDGTAHLYDGEVYSLVVNNRKVETPMEPIIFNDRALVPVREVFEEMGAEVSYNSGIVEIESDETDVVMKINDNIAYVNGRKTAIPDNVVPKLIAKVGEDAKTMVPVRFISEQIGGDVYFDGENDAILIDSDIEAFRSQIAYEEAVYEEPVHKPEVTDVSYTVQSPTQVNINIITDTAIDSYNAFEMSSPGRLVIDIANFSMAASPDNISVNKAGITSIRLGDNDERARIVVDSEDISLYNIEQISDTELEVSIVTNKAAAQPPRVNAPVSNASITVKPTTAPVSVPAGKKLVVLDAGHGGEDSGAVGTLDGDTVLEKNLALEITMKTKEILEKNGYMVLLTRDDDTFKTLVERPEMANDADAAVFVSIHINSVEGVPDANGTEVYYAASNNGDEYGASSEELAENILKNMLEETSATNRGVKTAEHAVTKRCNMPAALAEVGFITNEEELRNMSSDDYQYKAAQGIADGIIETLADITVPSE